MHNIKFSINPYFRHVRWRNLFVGALLIIGLTFSSSLQTYVAHATNCDDVRFIFARGSGEALADKSYSAWQYNITHLIENTGLSYSFYELGSRSYGGYKYPAISVSSGLSGITNLIGAAISAGEAFEFGRSVEQGKGELKAYFDFVTRACPQTKFVLGGYSQGAMVMSSMLGQLDSNKIVYVSTFGDPKLYLPEGKSKGSGRNRPQPDACRGINLSNYRLYVPDCHAYEGVLGSYRPYQPSQYLGKLGTWCNKHDIMCSSGMNIGDHTSYVSEELYGDAAETIRQKLDASFPDSMIHTKRNLHNLVFLFDTTGSMSSSINRYKSEAKKLAADVYASGGHVALFEFRDLKEDFPARELCNFSCTEAELNAAIDGLTASGGGDTDESLLSAVITAMNAVKWQNGATKSVVALTDAGYHDPDYDGTSYVAVVDRSLEIDPVSLYVVTTSSNVSKYQKLTAATGGRVFSLSDDDIQLSSNQIFSRPVAKLSMPAYSGNIGDSFTFDASSSYSLGDAPLSYDWDLDGDGIFEIMNASSVISHTYPAVFDDYIQVRVYDIYGSSTMSAKVTVVPASANALSQISHLDASMTAPDTAQINFTTDGDQVLASINDAIIGTIAVTNGQGSITVSSLDQDARITLTPYRQETRGVARAVTISETGDITVEENPTITDEPNYLAPNPDSFTTDSSIIPIAPDTGAYDKRCELKCQWSPYSHL